MSEQDALRRGQAERLAASLAEAGVVALMVVQPAIGDPLYNVAIAPNQDINVRDLLMAVDAHGFDLYLDAGNNWHLVPPPDVLPVNTDGVPEDVYHCSCPEGYLSADCDVPEHRAEHLRMYRQQYAPPAQWRPVTEPVTPPTDQARTAENDHLWTPGGQA